MKIVGISACARHTEADLAIAHRITDGEMDKSRASYVTAAELQLLTEFSDEVKDIIRKKVDNK